MQHKKSSVKSSSFVDRVKDTEMTRFQQFHPNPSDMINELNENDQINLDIIQQELNKSIAELQYKSNPEKKASAKALIAQKLSELNKINEIRREWEFRIAVYPSRENMIKAAKALEKVFSQEKMRGIVFKCLSLSKMEDASSKAWDGTQALFGEPSDRDQRGKEICVYMRYDCRTNQYQRTPAQWKDLMLRLWRALLDEKVEGIGYIFPHQSEKKIDTEPTIYTPFMYSGFKSSLRKHGFLFETKYNPNQTEDPLKGITITKKDLVEHKIPLSHVREISRTRLAYLKDHLQKTTKILSNDINKLTEKLKHETITDNLNDELKHVENLLLNKIKLTEEQKNVLNNKMSDIISRTPRSDDANLSCIPVTQLQSYVAQILEGKVVKEEEVKKSISELKHEILENRDARVREIIRDFQEHPEAIQDFKLEEKQLTRLIDRYPAEMQLIFRKVIHLHREKIATEKLYYELSLQPGDPSFLTLVNLINDHTYWKNRFPEVPMPPILENMCKLVHENPLKVSTGIEGANELFNLLKETSESELRSGSVFSRFFSPGRDPMLNNLLNIFRDSESLDDIYRSRSFIALTQDWELFHRTQLKLNH